MTREEAIEILEALGAGCDPETGEVLSPESALQNASVLRAIFLALRALKGSPSDDEGDVEEDGSKAPALNLAEAAKGELGLSFKIENGPQRFRQPGWFSVGPTTALCPSCKHALHGFRRPYLSSGRTFHYWGLICDRCPAAFDPHQLSDDSRSALYESSSLKPGSRKPQTDGTAAEAPKIEAELSAPDSALYLILQKKRLELAQRDDVPPFCVFKNRTLRDIASSKPVSKDELRKVFGVGQRLADRYGEEFLEIVRNHRKTKDAK